MSDINYLTRDGYEKLKLELEDLKKVQRPRISAQIAEARDKGDLSENAEYDAAKEAQGMLEMKISKMETLFASARVMDENKLDISKVNILTTVRLLNKNTQKEVKYTIVSEKEADLKTGRISVKSAVGSGLLGKKVGEIVEIIVPAGKLNLEILEITKG